LQSREQLDGRLDHHHVAARQAAARVEQGFPVAVAVFRTAKGSAVGNISSASGE
jgi:hypothetical protein